jgi:Uma2 family endonuclease
MAEFGWPLEAQDAPLSLEAYSALEDGPYRLELSRGRLVSEPGPGPEHGSVHSRATALLFEKLQRSGAGVVLVGTSFLLTEMPPTVRIPDLAVVRGTRPAAGFPRGHWRGAPDLAIEINSPSNSASDNLARVRDYFDGGTAMLWIVDPPTRSVTVHPSPVEARIMVGGDALPGGPAFPQLGLTVDELFGGGG